MSLKIRKEKKRTTEASLSLETDAKMVSPDEANDPRPLPRPHDRHLDVDNILERSLPRLSAEV